MNNFSRRIIQSRALKVFSHWPFCVTSNFSYLWKRRNPVIRVTFSFLCSQRDWETMSERQRGKKTPLIHTCIELSKIIILSSILLLIPVIPDHNHLEGFVSCCPLLSLSLLLECHCQWRCVRHDPQPGLLTRASVRENDFFFFTHNHFERLTSRSIQEMFTLLLLFDCWLPVSACLCVITVSMSLSMTLIDSLRKK